MLLQGFGCGMHWNCGSAAMVDVVPLEELQIVLDVVRVVVRVVWWQWQCVSEPRLWVYINAISTYIYSYVGCVVD